MRFLFAFILFFFFGCDVSKSSIILEQKIELHDVTESSSDFFTEKEIPFLYFRTTKHDFGKVNMKKVKTIRISFEFVNKGNAPLIIYDAYTPCKCLTINTPKKAIQKGENSNISVDVSTKNQKGIFNKHLILISNAENDLVVLRLYGKIY